MLPFTTYTMPEMAVNKTASSGHWLIFIAEQPFSPAQTELIQKIGAAVKADFGRDTYCWNSSADATVTVQEIITASTQLVISFGIAPSSIGLWMDLHNPGIRFLESFSFILTLPIRELEKNAGAKKELWKNMQMFMEMNQQQHA